MPRPRFSLRGLLLLTVAVAALYWYRDLPRWAVTSREQYDRWLDP
jgi:hypothetical protein